MKKLFVLGISIVSFFVFMNPVYADSWKLVKNKSGIKVFSKSIPGKKIKSFRAETVIKAELQDIAYLLNTSNAYKDWMADIIHSKLIKQNNDLDRYLYFIQKIPVFKNRDVAVRGILEQDPKTKKVTINVNSVKDVVKETKKYVRIPSLKIKLDFTPIGNGNLKVSYQIAADPGGKISPKIVNAYIQQNPFITLKGLRKLSPNLSKYRDSTTVMTIQNVDS